MMLTVAQAAEHMGVGTRVVYKLCATRELKHARIGNGKGLLRINLSDLEDYIERSSVQPSEPKRAPARRKPVNLMYLKRKKGASDE